MRGRVLCVGEFSFGVRQWPEIMLARPNDQLSSVARMFQDRGTEALAEPFKGISTEGALQSNLFQLGRPGASTRPIVDAATAYLDVLTPEQRKLTVFPIDSEEWRRWVNIHPYIWRHGVCLEDMTDEQRGRALGLMAATMSAGGFQTARDVMKLNETVMEMTGKPDEFGEWFYWISIFGLPSRSDPWGWQIDGHHLNINCLVLADQVVMTPSFMGSEPCFAEAGKYAGTRVFAAEERNGLALMQSLDVDQRARTTLGTQLPPEVFCAAFRDNYELRYEGIGYDELRADQQGRMRAVIETYVGHIRPIHAEKRIAEVAEHLDETYFAWAGDCDDDAVFYYRVHSPVIIIEFDHTAGIAFDNTMPTRNHVHTVVRTPNGNDYGKDLLRQHHERFTHSKPDLTH